MMEQEPDPPDEPHRGVCCNLCNALSVSGSGPLHGCLAIGCVAPAQGARLAAQAAPVTQATARGKQLHPDLAGLDIVCVWCASGRQVEPLQNAPSQAPICAWTGAQMGERWRISPLKSDANFHSLFSLSRPPPNRKVGASVSPTPTYPRVNRQRLLSLSPASN